jgi:hypothetical protein
VTAGRTYRYRLIVDLASGPEIFGPIEVTAGPNITAFALKRVWPSPTAGPVRIEFVVARATPVRLTVVDAQGRIAARLIDSALAPGSYQAVWSGGRSHAQAPGIYFVRLEASGLQLTKRVAVCAEQRPAPHSADFKPAATSGFPGRSREGPAWFGLIAMCTFWSSL